MSKRERVPSGRPPRTAARRGRPDRRRGPARDRLPGQHADRDQAQPDGGGEQVRRPRSPSTCEISAGARHARTRAPSDGITVTATHGGKITGVTVKTTSAHAGHGHAQRATAPAGTARYALPTGSVLHGDRQREPTAQVTRSPRRASSRTLTPATAFHTEIFEGAGATYGVGMPIMLTFDHPITNKAAVERALTLTTSNPVTGAWYWDGDEQLDFRPRDYWPAGTTVSFTSHLDGVEGAPGVYGVHDLSPDVQHRPVGHRGRQHGEPPDRRSTSTGSSSTTGRSPPGGTTMPTPDGTYLSVEKANPVRMVGGGKKGSPGYYNELVNWAVRFTYSGDYYHSAPWSVVNQGTSNVSHGCVNLAPEDAQIYYNMAIPGDPITITSSPKAGKWDDGWTQWFLSWSQYLAGSATHMAVKAGPHGSSFVKPSSLPADTAQLPLGTSVAGNYNAA